MILCIGVTPVFQRTMVFERVRLDAVNRAVEVRESASGKVNNVARVVRRLGEEVVACGFLGGNTGTFIRRDLDADDVAHDFVEVEPKTRTCVTLLDRGAGTATELVEESSAVEPSAWPALRLRIAEHLKRARVMVLSGSLTPGAPVDFFGQCVALAMQNGVETVVDASGEPLMHALGARPLVVKPNQSELARTFDITIDDENAMRDAMKRLIDGGAKWVIVTRGRSGAIVSDGGRFMQIRSPIVETVNPIGSGDSFAAGLAVGISRGQSVEEACKLGVACGAANAMTVTPADVRADDVAKLLPRIEVETW